jgi:hypothetical protein
MAGHSPLDDRRYNPLTQVLEQGSPCLLGSIAQQHLESGIGSTLCIGAPFFLCAMVS